MNPGVVMRVVLLTAIFFVAAGHASEFESTGLTELKPGVMAGTIAHENATFHVVTLPADQLKLTGQGTLKPRTPGALQDALAKQGERAVVATNGALFHDSFLPVGLHIEEGVQHRPLETVDGKGNFYWKPNAVFWIADGTAHLSPTPEWAAPPASLAIQSGPALVLDGVMHPGFKPDSTSMKLRSGLGIRGGEVVLVRSEGKVTFHAFASVFRDALKCEDALFLDGTISGLWAEGLPGVKRGFEYASFLYVSEPL